MLSELKGLKDTTKETWTNLGDRGIGKKDRLVVMSQIAQAAFRFTNIIHDSYENPREYDGSPLMNSKKQAFLTTQASKLIANVGQSMREKKARLLGEEHEFIDTYQTEEPTTDITAGTEPYTHDVLNDEISDAWAQNERSQFRVVK
jgi:hypothetical protein